MRGSRTGARTAALARRVLPWLAAWAVAQVAVRLLGRLASARWDADDAGGIRRVVAMDALELCPTDPALARIDVHLFMAGGEIDLTGIAETPGIDLTVRAVMGGLAVRVPPDWRVWSRFRGVGGIGTDGGLTRTHDPHAADLRVHGLAVFGGIGVEAAPRGA
jgi:hypothetical protein